MEHRAKSDLEHTAYHDAGHAVAAGERQMHRIGLAG